jgi:uncharacterized protein
MKVPSIAAIMATLVIFLVLGGVAVVGVLLISQDTPPEPKPGDMALWSACYDGNKEEAERLLASGADVNVHESHGGTALLVAVSQGHDDVAKLLVAHGATDVDLALNMAVIKNHVGIAKFLVAHGAKFTEAPFGGAPTPLMTAASYGNLEMVEWLISHGDKVNGGFEPPLQWAADGGYVEVMQLLVSKGAYINSRDDRNGWTPLHQAAYSGKVEAVKFLLVHGAPVDVKDRDNRTALDLAQEGNHADVMALLQK